MNKAHSFKQLLVNTVSGWVAIVARAGIAFVMVPVLIQNLGKEAYGLISLLSILIGLSQIADLGLRGALGRELSEQHAKQQTNEFNILANTAFVLYLSIAAILLLLLSFATPALVHLFKIPPDLKASAVQLIRIYGCASILLAFLTPVFSAALSSNHRFDLINGIQISSNTFFSALIILAIKYLNQGLWTWAMIMLCNQLCILLFSVYFTKRINPTFVINPRFFSTRHLPPLFKLGGYMYVLHLTNMLSMSSDPIVISSFFGPAGVALYQPARRFSEITCSIVTTLRNQLYPLTTKQHVLNMNNKLAMLLVAGTKYTIWMGSLVVVGTVFSAFPFCRLWLHDSLGSDYHVVAKILIAWALVDFSVVLTGTQWPVLLGMKNLRFMMWVYLPTAILNLLLSIYFVGYTSLGIPGVLLASIIIGFIRSPLTMVYTARVCGVSTWRYISKAYVSPFCLMAILSLAAFAVRLFYPLSGWLHLIIFCSILTATWALLGWIMVINKEERALLVSLLTKSPLRPADDNS